MCLAVPGKITELFKDEYGSLNGKISFSGVMKEVNMAYVPEACIGQYAVVHAGFAITLLDEDEAQEVLSTFQEFNDANDQNQD